MKDVTFIGELSAANAAHALVHVDGQIVVADKPAGMLSVPGRGAYKQDCLAARVQQAVPDALIVHRLDMATSGLIVMARGASMHRALSLAFASRQVEKLYVAVVAGTIQEDTGEIDLPLLADWPNRPLQQVDAGGKPSRTRWRVLARDTQSTRVELEPVTGRTHQLRVHLQAIGHPILGDELYAPPAVRVRSPRLLLHASRIAFAHPLGGERVAFESLPPF